MLHAASLSGLHHHPGLTAGIPPPMEQETIPCDIKLLNADLWRRFHEIGTEMIITKGGRRMFPSLRVSLGGLEAREQYCVLLELRLGARRRLRWAGGAWAAAGGAEPQSARRLLPHPDSPAPGAHWMANPVSFSKIKLTNNTMDTQGHMVLTSMHKYRPRVLVVRAADLPALRWGAPHAATDFPETEFIAVTAYQNDRITKLKIDNNPFAKGFRACGQSKCKRKSLEHTSEGDEKEGKAEDSSPKRLCSSTERLCSGSENGSSYSDEGSTRSASPSPPSPHNLPPPLTFHPYSEYSYGLPAYRGAYASWLPAWPSLPTWPIEASLDLTKPRPMPLQNSTKAKSFTIRSLLGES